MAVVMLAAYPELFAGGAIIAGVPYGVASNIREGLALMRGEGLPGGPELAERVRRAGPPRRRGVRIVIWQGEADGAVHPVNGEALARQWVGVLGLPDEPQETELSPGRSRTLWRSSLKGGAAVELNLLHGLEHGAPLASLGPAGLGAAAPFMLEAGVSSTLEAVRFWGLAAAAPGLAPPAAGVREAPQPTAPREGLRRRLSRLLLGPPAEQR